MKARRLNIICRQLAAVAHAELRFGLRRGWPVIGTGIVLLVISAGTLYLAYMNIQGAPRDLIAQESASSLVMVWMSFPSLALGVLPIVAAPAVPTDRQLGVSELLRGTSLTGGLYLAGKVLGTGAAVLLTGVVGLIAHLAVHWIVIGPFDAGLYLELALWAGLPLLLWASTIGVLAACGARTRKTAILIGVPVGLLSLLTQSTGFELVSDRVLSRHGLWGYWPGTSIAGGGGTPFWPARWPFLLLLIELLAIGALARLWLWWRENF
ncbi:MAG: hypothetical protein JW934_08780 [Anaerolineae bacterium]|nr:hypothetical protein [Anaerolineae bacterium]